MTELKRWQDVTPQEALDLKLDLSTDTTYTAPLNENGERCPWPWDPQQLVGMPIGQYHCPYCGAMSMAGMEHPDYYIGWEEEMMKAIENTPPDAFEGEEVFTWPA